MRNADGIAPRATLRSRVAACALACALSWAPAGDALSASASSQAGGEPYTFAVLSGVIASADDEPRARRLLDAIARDRSVSFIVYEGNLKGPKEACRDQLYEQRNVLFTASRVPLVLLPGQYDWAACGTRDAGAYDPVERLDFLRQNVFTEPASPGANSMPLTRESEVPRFRPYRENVRWVRDATVFIGLNAPGPNNRYLTAGGRNGEFEDRAIANAFWIDHAAEYAKRRKARALVVFLEGDPQFDRYERSERFGWLRFNRPRVRDGFREFKRALVKAAAVFRGSIVVVHPSGEPLASGFRIDRPLRDDKGDLVGNLTRVAIAPHARLTQWVRIGVDSARQPMFNVSLQTVPRHLPQPPALPFVPHDDTPLPDMPEIPAPPVLPDSSARGAMPPDYGEWHGAREGSFDHHAPSSATPGETQGVTAPDSMQGTH
ncbi:FKBP-type peptidyl-prolyl cis-trans isomerases 2 [Burkholderia thailandensis 34]|uniref:hypothetical protein n=1 Tax=Burkholderia thailandensis TaxID=57975 RepID=UPI0005D758BB|nr:hypothetical protein [Burkholderia thailandensis]AJY29794.1 FKBP-type peptidyl-prolyl cis-trans isomerases 2 [Burkholderia thailandensis 34]AOJ57211.1 hypothetical protein AQ477_12375 [Burkholderia thailandensis]KXF61900.1 hypothetical protein AQ476_11745 [Burkholderia thailandensis]PNE74011.1 hypothetical protein A8H37_19165 [Burkholderia thailandensis]